MPTKEDYRNRYGLQLPNFNLGFYRCSAFASAPMLDWCETTKSDHGGQTFPISRFLPGFSRLSGLIEAIFRKNCERLRDCLKKIKCLKNCILLPLLMTAISNDSKFSISLKTSYPAHPEGWLSVLAGEKNPLGILFTWCQTIGRVNKNCPVCGSWKRPSVWSAQIFQASAVKAENLPGCCPLKRFKEFSWRKVLHTLPGAAGWLDKKFTSRCSLTWVQQK